MALALFLIDIESSRNLARQRVFRDRLNPIDVYNDVEFISRYRVTKFIIVRVEEKVLTFLHRLTIRSHLIPATTQLAVALQFLGYWFLPNCGCIVTWNISAISLPMYPYGIRCTMSLCYRIYCISKPS